MKEKLLLLLRPKPNQGLDSVMKRIIIVSNVIFINIGLCCLTVTVICYPQGIIAITYAIIALISFVCIGLNYFGYYKTSRIVFLLVLNCGIFFTIALSNSTISYAGDRLFILVNIFLAGVLFNIREKALMAVSILFTIALLLAFDPIVEQLKLIIPIDPYPAVPKIISIVKFALAGFTVALCIVYFQLVSSSAEEKMKEMYNKLESQSKKLEISEANFKQISETISDSFYLYDISEKKYEYVSPNCKTILGVDQKKFYEGGSLTETNIIKDDLSSLKEGNIKINNGEPYDIAYRITINDEIRWIREQSFPIRNENGLITKKSGVCSDITKQKRTIEQLETSYENTKLLSVIGFEIIEKLSIVKIIENVRERVNQLMDASIFAVGIVDNKKNQIVFPLFIENENKYINTVHSLDKNIMATICIKKGIDIIIDDIEQDVYKYTEEPLDATNGDSPASLIYLPLKFKEEIIGVITVQSPKKNAYSENHINLLRNLSIYISNALANAKLYETLEYKVIERTKEVMHQKEMLERNYETTKLLSQIGSDISSSLNFEHIFDQVHQNIGQLLNAEIFGVRIYNEEEEIVEYKYEIESGVRDGNIKVPFSDKNNYTVWCISNKKELLINDNLKEYNKYINKIQVPSGKMPHSLIFCPMIVDDKVLGAITVQSFEKNAYQQDHMDIVKTLAFYAGIALSNANLYQTLESKVVDRTIELSQKNKEIMDSISYAKHIQDATLTKDKDRLNILPDSFVFYQPKDVLSGDFYRIDRIKNASGDNLVAFMVGDCTGHGVPGATLAILCSNIMKHAITDDNVICPGDSLNSAREQLNVFFQSSVDSMSINDGMDAAICEFNERTRFLRFSGALCDCIIIRGKELIILKGDRKHVGHHEDVTPYTTHEFQLKKNDCIYLTTDGFTDQFGGEKDKKYMRKRFLKMLKKGNKAIMQAQGEYLKTQFDEWKGINDQTDDVCVIGVRVG